MHAIMLLLASLALATVSRTAHAQGGAPHLPNGTTLGLSLTKFAERLSLDESVTALTFRSSVLRRNSIGLELDAGIFPQVLPSALIVTLDGGPGYNLSLPGATIVLRGGAGGIVGIGGGVLFVPGAHLGASAIVRLDARTALRLDLLRHFYLTEGEVYPYWSLGLGFAVLPR